MPSSFWGYSSKWKTSLLSLSSLLTRLKFLSCILTDAFSRKVMNILMICSLLLSRSHPIIIHTVIFTFSSHTEYVKRESIVIVWVKKNSPFNECSFFVCLRSHNKLKKNFCLSVCLVVWLSVRGLWLWTQ